MKKILPILLVGILVLSGLGACALSLKDNSLVTEVEKNENLNEGTHTVLAEFGTASDCQYCPSHEQFLYQVQGDFEIVTLAATLGGGGYNSAIQARLSELGLTGFPTSFWDGKYTKVVGGQSSIGPLQNAYNSCASRTVANVDLELSVNWLGNAKVQIDINVINSQNKTYNGHIHVYVMEITSRWYNYNNQPFKDAMLDCPINQDITLDSFKPILSGPTVGKIGIPCEFTLTMEDYIWSNSIIWDGNQHSYGDITENNIEVVAAVFTKSTQCVDQTLKALPSEHKQTNPAGAQLFYWLEWGDGTNSGWSGPFYSNEETKISHIYNLNGTYEIIAKSRNTNYEESAWSNPILLFIGNVAPNKPQISGPTTGNIKTNIEFIFVATDPNEDNLYYTIKWGDGTVEDWFGPYNSGQEVKMSHSWKKEGTWYIQAKVKDIAGVESDWATLNVNIPRTRQSFNLLFSHILEQFPVLNKLLNNLLGY